MSNASDIDAVNAYMGANPGRTGDAVAAFTNWVVWYAKHGTTDADVTKARALLVAFDKAQGGKLLAPGFYWIDLLSTDALAIFTAWRRAYSVTVRKTTESQSPYRAWVQFEVKAPGALWSLDALMGRPTATTKDADVTAAGGFEPTPDVLDQVADKLSVDSLAGHAGTLLVVGAVVAAVALAVSFGPQLALAFKRK